MIAFWVNYVSDALWAAFLPLLILLGLYINFRMLKIRKVISPQDDSPWKFSKISSALSISLASKTGTGAIIGVLAAMWLSSLNGAGGEGIVLWIVIGMLVMVPITYSEVLFTQVTRLNPRQFIAKYFGHSASKIYALGLVALYAFGFVGFQFSGVQTVVRLFSEQFFSYEFTSTSALFGIVVPILLAVSLVIFTKSHQIFVSTLSSMIFSLIVAYVLFFCVFVLKTSDFVLDYLSIVYHDFIQLRSAGFGLPLGLIFGFQRIIQISETSLGTAALSSSERLNSPRREAMVQSLATIISIFIAVIITSYIFSYGRHHFSDVQLVADGFSRIKGFIFTAYYVTGVPGAAVVLAFFIISGFTTILGSFHYVNTSLNLPINARIVTYLILISASGSLSVANFGVIFDASNLLMFLVGAINLIAISRYLRHSNF
ncbi:sodium:alanine symporter [Vibrio crassostreae 9ZC13]|uniref:sodium:alanine symporter family protein n=1 Tax=Vibrio crassostreae TaxID=246167 RepID=UPI000315B26A|nr:sodium:alanine symporter family protein [Vibrio crassostreae]OED82734.1 sodium:alanine symporter [Vibrio crassostreae ZF-91]OEF02093.1 sodium:alanine symporter [Vibrio crassostreae 9ZC13]